ncbi:NAD-binding protein [Streptomyces sp. HSW2009]|uniref:NAD-binding protein n=1 Tax=Streptomyces sp. HSW2009 TaxID=3142890 RepID=UPI0032EFFFF9
MIVCGDDALAHRLASELRSVYGERITLVVPPAREAAGAPVRGRAVGRATALFGRVSAAMARAASTGGDPAGGPAATGTTVVEAAGLDDAVLVEAGVERAAALALVHDDDEANIRAALAARRLSPQLRLVIRLYNRKLGQRLEELLDQAAVVTDPGQTGAGTAPEAVTTVLSDADTAAPALAATAIAGTSKVVQADGLMLRLVERAPTAGGEIGDQGLGVLALLSSTVGDPAGADGSDSSGAEGPQLLPDQASVRAATGRRALVLETVSHGTPTSAARRLGRRWAPLTSLLPARLRWSIAGVCAAVLALAVVSWLVTGAHPLHAGYLTLLDLFAMGEPAIEEGTSRQAMQLLSGLIGLMLLPVMVAAALEAFGTFRTASALRRPPRGLSGHVVLLGLGKVGTRVLVRLREMDIPVVCVENDPQARGVAVARRMRVPTVLGDVTQEGVLEAAKIHRAHALLALTSVDITNLEAALYARSIHPELRVALRLYDDGFATAVYRTLRAAHPQALTRSRSVSSLAAPAFAGAMMGRQVLGAFSVERKVLLLAAVEVAGHPQLVGRTVADASRPGSWRVLALDASAPGPRPADLGAALRAGPGEPRQRLVWDLDPAYVLRPADRVVLVATRRGLAELLGRPQARRAG